MRVLSDDECGEHLGAVVGDLVMPTEHLLRVNDDLSLREREVFEVISVEDQSENRYSDFNSFFIEGVSTGWIDSTKFWTKVKKNIIDEELFRI